MFEQQSDDEVAHLLVNEQQESQIPQSSEQRNGIDIDNSIEDSPVKGYDDEKEIEHEIRITDTLAGLAIQYGIAIEAIRLRNQLQNDEIFYRKKLIIPCPRRLPRPIENDEETKQELMINYFVQSILDSKDRNRKVALYYLSSSDWDLKKATAAYESDLKWEVTTKKTNPKLQLYTKEKKT